MAYVYVLSAGDTNCNIGSDTPSQPRSEPCRCNLCFTACSSLV